jgi:hypothetical protein
MDRIMLMRLAAGGALVLGSIAAFVGGHPWP